MSSTVHHALAYSAVVISILAVLENLLVLLVLAKSSHLRLKYFAFVFNLALADLAFAALIIVDAFVEERALSAFLQVCFFAAVLTILAVAVNRYLALALSTARYDALVTPLRLIVACLLIWAFSGLFILPIFFAASSETRLTLSAWLRSPLIFAVWIATAVLYLIVFRKIKSYMPTAPSSPVDPTTSPDQADTYVLQTRRLVVAFSVILVTSFFSWAPYNIGQIIEYFIKNDQSNIPIETFNTYTLVSDLIYCLSPAINPLVYWWRLDGFRQGFKDVFCCCLRQDRELLINSVDENEDEQNIEPTG